MASDNVLFFPDADEIEQRAAEWIVRLADGSLSDEEQAAFRSWHAASVQHREAFSRLSRLWEHCDVLSELADHAAADVTSASRADRGSVRSDALRFLPNRRVFLAAGVASVALLAGSALYDLTIVAPFATDNGVYATVAETAVGERRTVALPDGSSVELNTASHVVVEYTSEARLVSLSRGEAHFTVASNPQRPFSVRAAGRVITAVGTAFTVQLRRDAVEVIVAEGRVTLSEPEVNRAEAAAAVPDVSRPALQAGQNALLRDGQQQVAALAPMEIERRLAWRQGVLAFAGEPLVKVLGEIGRYTDVVIEITDADLRDLPVAGSLRIDDVESMLEALELMADVRVERLDDRHVRLRRRV